MVTKKKNTLGILSSLSLAKRELEKALEESARTKLLSEEEKEGLEKIVSEVSEFSGKIEKKGNTNKLLLISDDLIDLFKNHEFGSFLEELNAESLERIVENEQVNDEDKLSFFFFLTNDLLVLDERQRKMLLWLVENTNLKNQLNEIYPRNTVFHHVAFSNQKNTFEDLFCEAEKKPELYGSWLETNGDGFTILHSAFSGIVYKVDHGVKINWEPIKFMVEKINESNLGKERLNESFLVKRDKLERTAWDIVDERIGDNFSQEYVNIIEENRIDEISRI
ncbi:MAG: hypothetical protein LBR43_04125 [Spiroplasmataceae bacterium]|nr:hypothetical protein [Spiroplasmataceae bacterium]